MLEWKKEVNDADEEGEVIPPIPEYIGECFYKIATHLSYRPNFINYTYREEMIGDGIENCVQYIHNFDPNKSNNPFAYFTQIIYYAFLRRIQKEKKQLEIKTKIIERTGYDQVMVVEDGAGGTSSDYNTCLLYTSPSQRDKRQSRMPSSA